MRSRLRCLLNMKATDGDRNKETVEKYLSIAGNLITPMHLRKNTEYRYFLYDFGLYIALETARLIDLNLIVVS